MDSVPETRSWMANWRDQKKMNILRVMDRSVTMREEPWLENFEKYRKNCDFGDFIIIFHQFSWGSVGARSQDMNIYTFWIDLDVPRPILK